MAILTTKKVWKLERVLPPKKTLRACELTQAEQDNVRAAVAQLRAQYPTWPALANALGVRREMLAMMRSGARRPTVGLALRLARLTRVAVEDVLGGVPGRPGRCSVCGK